MSFLVLCIRNDAGSTCAIVSWTSIPISIKIASRKEWVVMFMSSVLVGSIDVE